MHSDNRALTLAVGPFCLLKPGEDKKVTIFLNSYKIFLLPQFDRDQLSYIKYPGLSLFSLTVRLNYPIKSNTSMILNSDIGPQVANNGYKADSGGRRD